MGTPRPPSGSHGRCTAAPLGRGSAPSGSNSARTRRVGLDEARGTTRGKDRPRNTRSACCAAGGVREHAPEYAGGKPAVARGRLHGEGTRTRDATRREGRVFIRRRKNHADSESAARRDGCEDAVKARHIERFRKMLGEAGCTRLLDIIGHAVPAHRDPAHAGLPATNLAHEPMARAIRQSDVENENIDPRPLSCDTLQLPSQPRTRPVRDLTPAGTTPGQPRRCARSQVRPSGPAAQ